MPSDCAPEQRNYRQVAGRIDTTMDEDPLVGPVELVYPQVGDRCFPPMPLRDMDGAPGATCFRIGPFAVAGNRHQDLWCIRPHPHWSRPIQEGWDKRLRPGSEAGSCHDMQSSRPVIRSTAPLM
jgi:hypothetical protein